MKYAWARSGPAATTFPPPQVLGLPMHDTYEIFPKPDRALTLYHDYYAWLSPPSAGVTDIILERWGEMFAEYLLYKMLASIGEHDDSRFHQQEYEKEKARFSAWDESLYGDEQWRMRTKQRDGTEDAPMFA